MGIDGQAAASTAEGQAAMNIPVPQQWLGHLLTTICVVCSCFAAGVLLRPPIREAWPSDRDEPPVSLQITADLQVGDKLCAPGVDFGKAERSLIVVMTESCSACGESEPFLSELLRGIRKRSLRVYVFVPPSFSSIRLTTLGIRPEEIFHTDVRQLGLKRVPTFAAIDKKGSIQTLIVGSVTNTDQATAQWQLLESSMAPITRLSRADLGAFSLAYPAFQLVDVRSRAQLLNTRRTPTIKYIPYDELNIRAPYELDMHRPIVLDCEATHSLYCADAVTTLQIHHIEPIATVGFSGPRSSEFCGMMRPQ